MKKILAFLFTFLLAANAYAAGPGGTSGSVQVNKGDGTFLGLLQNQEINGAFGWTTPFLNAASALFQITNGKEVDPRIFGAACNTQYFASGYDGAPNNPTVTTQGSPTINIQGYTPQNCTSAPGKSCDIGKVVSMFASNDVGPTWLYNSSTSPLTITSVNATSGGNITLATNLQGSNTGTGGNRTGIVMGGYNGQDDTAAFQQSIYFSAPYHGGKIVVPPYCLIHDLKLAGGFRSGAVWLAGNNGAPSYNSPAAPFNNTTPMYISSNNYAEDPILGIDMCGAQGTRITDVAFIGTVFPFLTFFNGTSLAAVGSSCAVPQFAPGEMMLERNVFGLFPVGFGMPLGLNNTVTLNGQVAPGTNILTVNSVSSTNIVSRYGVGLFASTTTPDYIVPAGPCNDDGNCQTLTGSGVPGSTHILGAISYLAGQTTGMTYALDQTITAGVSAESMAVNSPTMYVSGELNDNQFISDWFGFNGDITDYREHNNNYTNAPLYIGPYTGGSPGNSANSFYGDRVEDTHNNTASILGAITLDLGVNGSTQGTYQFNGIYCQFNDGPCLLTKNVWSDIIVTGGIISGNGVTAPTRAQIVLGGTGTRFAIDGTMFNQTNFAFGGNASYLLATTTGAVVSQVSINGGNVAAGFTVAPTDFSRAAVSGYRQTTMGLPVIDTTLGYTIGGALGLTSTSGGASLFTGLSNTTTNTGTVVISNLYPVSTAYDCALKNVTSTSNTYALSGTTSSTCSFTMLGTVTTGDKLLGGTTREY